MDEDYDSPSSTPGDGCLERRVFLVDDDPGIRRTIARALSTTGFLVRHFGGAQECLKEIVKKPCDLLITDIQMPGMDGVALLRQVRHRLPSLPITVMSGDGGPETRSQAASGGSAGFLEKPLGRDDLVDAVEKALRRHADAKKY